MDSKLTNVVLIVSTKENSMCDGLQAVVAHQFCLGTLCRHCCLYTANTVLRDTLDEYKDSSTDRNS